METSEFRNARLSARASGYRCVRISSTMLMIPLTTYLIISCYKLRNSIENPCSRELTQACHFLEVQFLLLLLLRQPPLLCGHPLLLHCFPCFSRNRPMIDLYAPLFALFLIYIIVLTKMQATWRISTLMERLALAIYFQKVLIHPKTQWVVIYLLILHLRTYLQIVHHLPVSVSYLSPATLKFTVTLSVITVKRSSVESFFTGFVSSSAPWWRVVRPS